MRFLAPRKKSRTNFCRRTFLVEPLESRSLLAGDVMAALDATGSLLLSGDAKANNLDISFNSTAGAYVLTASNTTLHDINGLVVPQLILNSTAIAGFSGNIAMDLKAGNDVVTINGDSATNLAQSLSINTGVGNDSISIGGIAVGDLTVQGGAGSDTLDGEITHRDASNAN